MSLYSYTGLLGIKLNKFVNEKEGGGTISPHLIFLKLNNKKTKKLMYIYIYIYIMVTVVVIIIITHIPVTIQNQFSIWG